MAPKEHVFVVYDKTANSPIEAHKTNDSAKAAVEDLKADGSSDVEILKVELKSDSAGTKRKAKSTATAKAKGGKKDKSTEPEDDEGGDRDAIPEGIPNVLSGLKLLFTGTMTMDRKTSKATAEKYGAKVITKLEDTDYIILGTRPGEKKVQQIRDEGLDTITEEEFFEMLKEGVPQDKLDEVAARADDEPPAKKSKK